MCLKDCETPLLYEQQQAHIFKGNQLEAVQWKRSARPLNVVTDQSFAILVSLSVQNSLLMILISVSSFVRYCPPPKPRPAQKFLTLSSNTIKEIIQRFNRSVLIGQHLLKTGFKFAQNFIIEPPALARQVHTVTSALRVSLPICQEDGTSLKTVPDFGSFRRQKCSCKRKEQIYICKHLLAKLFLVLGINIK